jgi:hypothetical protein
MSTTRRLRRQQRPAPASTEGARTGTPLGASLPAAVAHQVDAHRLRIGRFVPSPAWKRGGYANPR